MTVRMPEFEACSAFKLEMTPLVGVANLNMPFGTMYKLDLWSSQIQLNLHIYLASIMSH